MRAGPIRLLASGDANSQDEAVGGCPGASTDCSGASDVSAASWVTDQAPAGSRRDPRLGSDERVDRRQ
jgi:hypothetical protein